MLLKRQSRWSVDSTCAAAISLALFAALPAEARDFTAADTQGADHPTVQSIRYMDRLVRERSHGRHRINVYPGGMLGAQPATLEQTRIGSIDLNLVNVAPLASFVGETNFLGLPFLFRSADHLRRVLNSPIGEQVLQRSRRTVSWALPSTKEARGLSTPPSGRYERSPISKGCA
jgi:TRAP-type C4-dicarboxylate transport system substrate-binding protein